MVTSAVRRSIGAVLGALVIGAALLSGVLEALPGPVVTVAFLFGGGLVAGLLTRGRIMDGAITGAVSGVVMALLVASATTIKSLVASSPQYPPPWATFGFYALVLTILLLPYNAIGGAVGTAVRNSIRRGGTPGAGERTRWLGIGIGTVIIAASTLLLVSSVLVIDFLGPLLMVTPIVGGFIAGFAAGGETRDGLEAGFLTALFGTGLFSLPFLWIASHGEGFVAGLAGMVAIALGYPYIILGTAAGVAGAVVRANLRRNEGA
ncbi:MAG TPA: DUF5518 domain-containing protein [Candidatus Methanoculleus thermohydrogenotrophicum]|jgi:hypothetical protein|nr:DUF5518 domain-containing protein [Candidatus Methanoculleus thermohydrogenotrophicum]HPZ38103.1 DUF5518 domain-containing protein [Candidatus Methanoculleus thermohydrogenotrophicum]HQC91325.1 DUF5518 domain-containing protein [Candidatus Methanoculleus thermohydrogenotrophicum]